MYIHRGLLLLIIIAFILSPIILDWITRDATAWYRLFFAWFSLILLAYLLQRFTQRGKHD